MDRTTLLRATRPLQREGLVRKERSANDTRQLVFSLSPAGQRNLRHAMRLWQDAQTEFEAQVGSDHAARLRRELLTLARPV